MEDRTNKKSISEKLLKLFSKKLNHLQQQQNYIFGLICILVVCQIAQFFYFQSILTEKKETDEPKTKTVYRSNKTVFLGDSITYYYDLQKYFKNINFINSGISGNTTKDILDNIQTRLFDYSPKTVFLLIGTNDKTVSGYRVDETVKNIELIISKIKNKLPNTKLYVESIYPINDTDNSKIDHGMVNKRKNSMIREMNEKIEKLCDEYDITYIDMYAILKDDDNNLKLEYTKEGLHISEKGYEVITKELRKYM